MYKSSISIMLLGFMLFISASDGQQQTISDWIICCESDGQEALECCDKALELNPDDATLWENKGKVLSKLGDFKGAKECFLMADDLTRRWSRGFDDIQLEAIQLEADEKAIDKGAANEPAANEAALEWFDKAFNLTTQGDYDGAIKAYDKAIELDPNYAAPFLFKGSVLQQQGDYTEAIQAYETATNLNPKYKEAWFKKADALNSSGRLDESVAAYDITLQLDPDRYEAWYNKGLVLEAQGKFDEAKQAFEKVIEINPQYGDAKDKLQAINDRDIPESTPRADRDQDQNQNSNLGVELGFCNLPWSSHEVGSTIDFIYDVHRSCSEQESRQFRIEYGINDSENVHVYKSTLELQLDCDDENHASGRLDLTIPTDAPTGTYSSFIVLVDPKSSEILDSQVNYSEVELLPSKQTGS